MSKIQVGSKVAYSVQFLKAIFASHSNLARARGVVTELNSLSKECVLATIEWGNNEIPAKVNVKNLAIVGVNRKFCNVD